jgi:hypothetical protein
MTRGRRVSIIGIVALATAACGSAPVASPGLSAAASPAPSTVSPTGTASVTPSVTIPTPESWLRPTLQNTCAGLTAGFAPPTFELYPQIGHLGVDFGPERAIPHRLPDATFNFEPAVFNEDAGDLPAGLDVPMEASLFYTGVSYAAIAPIELVSLHLTVHTEGQQGLPIPIRWERRGVVTWDVVASGVPDVDGIASVEFAAEWTDRCFTYSGHARLDGVTLFSTTTTAGCRISPDQDMFWDELNDTFGDPIFVDGQPVDVFWQKAEARYVPVGGPGGDSAPAYASWDRTAAPVVADPSAVLRVAQSTPEFELLTMMSYFYDRADIIDALKVLGQTYPPPNPAAVFHREPPRQADGSFNLRVPKSPGRYMAWLDFTFSSRCATGRAWSVFSLTVQDPA